MYNINTVQCSSKLPVLIDILSLKDSLSYILWMNMVAVSVKMLVRENIFKN